jgi:integrase
LDDHVFISLRRKPLLVHDAERAFRTAAREIGLKREPGRPRPTIHALRHSSGSRIIPATDGRCAYFPEDRAICDALMAA